jgi:hypothetical protein
MTGLKTSLDIYRAVEALLKGVEVRAPIVVVVKRPPSQDALNVKELYLYEVVVNVGGRPAYSEVVGLAVKEGASTEIYEGSALLGALSRLLLDVVGVGDQFCHEERFGDAVRSRVLYDYRDIMVDDFIKYLAGVEKGFSAPHKGWIPREGEGRDASHFISASQRLLGVVVVAGEAAKARPPPIAVEEVERRAMEFAMEFERRDQRSPEDVSKVEHYDVRSVDPRTGEVRFIEVKGRWDVDITVELTETEYEYARRLGENYWLYVVYGLSTDNPRLLAIRDPVNRARWSAVEVKRYRLLGM